MKNILSALLCIAFLGAAHSVKAQALGSDYKTAVGLKFYPAAITVKHFTKSNTAVEGLLYLWNDGMRVTGLYEYHGDISDVPGLKWYIGGGAHAGFWNNNWRVNNPHRNRGINIGVDGILGLDYKINGAPINITLDWQPSVSIIGYNYWEAGWGGLGIRFTW